MSCADRSQNLSKGQTARNISCSLFRDGMKYRGFKEPKLLNFDSSILVAGALELLVMGTQIVAVDASEPSAYTEA